MKLLVSRCLLGEPCRYDGQSKPLSRLEELLAAGHTLVPVCPEVLGGLPTPRPPAEVQPDGRVCCAGGQDVTASFQAGAEQTLALALREGCQAALLKENSPSCGFGSIYSGDFSKTLVSGSGLAARLLADTCVLQLMIALNRDLQAANALPDAAAYRFDPKMEEVTRFIREHLAEELTIERLAGTFFLSRFYLMHRFKDVYGCTVHQYIRQKRLQQAAEQIRLGVPVLKAAGDAGFRDYSVFLRAFRGAFGKSPRQWK